MLTEIALPPLEPLNVTPGSTTTLVELDFTCNAVGSYKLTLTAVPDSPAGAFYADVNANIIELKTVPQDYDGDTVPNQVADTITINCTSGTVTPGPSPTPTALPTPTPPRCPFTSSGSPLPGMSLEAPATVLAGATFTLCVNADPAPNVAISGFTSEVVFPAGLKWVQRPTCAGSGGEVQVEQQDGGPLAFCLSQITTLLGGAGHAALTEIAVLPLEPLNVTPDSTATLVELDFTCTAPGSHKLTLTAEPDSGFGALYGNLLAQALHVKTVAQELDLNFDGVPEPHQVADTIVIECVAPVGGLVVDLAPEQDGLPAATGDSRAGNARLLAAVAAGVTAAALALTGTAWYGRRRARERSRG